MTRPGNDAECTQEKPFVTVVIPCRDEARHIECCLQSILATRYPHSRIEVIVIDGGSTDGTPDIVERIRETSSRIRIHLHSHPCGVQAAGLNAAIDLARGDIIVRVDGHAFIGPDYIPAAVDALEKHEAGNVGGVMHIIPGADTLVARAIAAVNKHPFGIGRHYVWMRSCQLPTDVDHVSFGVFRKQIVAAHGIRFNERLARGEDVDFNRQIRLRGLRVVFVPELAFYYFARPDLRTFVNYHFRVGQWAALGASAGDPPTRRQLLPAVALCLGLTLLLLSVFEPAAIWLLAACSAAYVMAALAATVSLVRRTRRNRAISAAIVFIAFVGMHLAHGTGVVAGACRRWERAWN